MQLQNGSHGLRVAFFQLYSRVHASRGLAVVRLDVLSFDIAFVGGFEHTPNTDAVKYFVKEVWPLVRELKLDAKFIVVGSKVPEEIHALAEEDIIIKGWAPDLSEIFCKVRLSVAPLRFGAGVKGKILSSLSHGTPCVASSNAVEGTGMKHGVHILVCDDPLQVAHGIKRLYSDEVLWEKLSDEGYRFCRNRFSHQAVGLKLLGLLNDLGIQVR